MNVTPPVQAKRQPVNSYRKGYRGETELADILSRLLGVPVRRGASPYLPGFMARDVVGLPGIHCEVKRREKVCLSAALAQARRDSGGYLLPLVCHRANGQPWLVTVELSDLPRLAAIVHCLLTRRDCRPEPASVAGSLPGDAQKGT